MTKPTLPPGYLAIDETLAVHVATLRRFTDDVQRVERWLPVCRQIQQHPPGSAAAFKLLSEYTPAQVDEVITTLRELGALTVAVLDELKRDAAPDERPPLLFRVRR